MRFRFVIILSVVACMFLTPGKGISRESVETCKDEAVIWIDAHQERFIEAARAIYDYAETSLREHRSAEYLAAMLEQDGFTVERGVAGMPTAFVATFGTGKPVIGILAEYDALPGLSQKPGSTSHESLGEGTPGHGCGHNLFGAGSVASALAVKAVMTAHGLSGTVVLFGCPAEETGIGKVYMAKEGIFDSLDACFVWHPSAENKVQLQSSRALNNFEVVFHGRTAHGAADPWNGRSALDAVELMNIGVNYLREHVKDPVRIHYVIPGGGMAPNIVPDYAKVWYFVRDIDRAGVAELYERVLDCARGAALMSGTTMEVNLITGNYNYLPNHALSAVLDKNLREIGTPTFTPREQAFAREMQRNLGVEEAGMNSEIEPFVEPTQVTGGSTDVANVSWIVPTAGELTVVTAPRGIPWHSWAVSSASCSSIGFKGMNIAAKVLAVSVIETLIDSSIVEQARSEFGEKTAGHPYENPVPDDQQPPLPKE